MARLFGNLADSGQVTVTQDGNGEGTASVSFTEDFVAVPLTGIIPYAADTAMISFTSSTADGFSMSVSGSAMKSRDVVYTWFAFEMD